MPKLRHRSATTADVKRLLRLLGALAKRVDRLAEVQGERRPALLVLSDLLTLEEVGSAVHRSKSTMARYRDYMPAPRILGRRGRPHRWDWAEVRPWLEKTFGLCLPEHLAD